MSYESIAALGQLINDGRLKVGNSVLNSAGTQPIGSGYQLYSDTTGKLQVASSSAGSFVNAHSSDGATIPLKVDQDTVTLAAADIYGSGAEDVMTRTIVQGALTSLTGRGFIRIRVESNSDQVATTGFYYIPFGQLD